MATLTPGRVASPIAAGAALPIVRILTLFVAAEHRKPVFTLRCVGITSHFVIDYFLWQPTGTTNRMRWPILDLTVDYQGFYRSSDRWPAVVATITAGIVLGIDRFVVTGQSRELEDGSPVQ